MDKEKEKKVEEVKEKDNKKTEEVKGKSDISERKKVKAIKEEVKNEVKNKAKSNAKNKAKNKTNKPDSKNNKNDFNWFDGRLKYVLVFLLGVVFTICLLSCTSRFFVNDDSNKNNVSSDRNLSKVVDKIYDSTVFISDLSGNVKGMGFVYKKDNNKGYIVSNYSAVNEGLSKVILSNDKEVDSEYIGGDKYLDIAIISIDENDVKKVADIKDSLSTDIGDEVFTLGTFTGENYSTDVKQGILSGNDKLVKVSVNDSKNYAIRMLQTDINLNSKNSGGPLCDKNGKVIGIISLRNNDEGTYAMPIEDALRYVESLENGEGIKKPYLGIGIINLSNTEGMDYYGLNDKVNTELHDGVVVESINDDSPAFGKLEIGDIIVKINDNEVKDSTGLRYELSRADIGDKTVFTVERDGKLKDIKIELVEENDN